ncbi:MAG: hemerythrin domain-containing protein [Acidimicrobiia bacterium]
MAAKSSPTRRRNGSTPRDAIAVLKADHRAVEKLFKEFERADGAHRQRQLVDSMIEELSRHAAIEEQLLYPWARDYIEDVDDTVLEALEEHRIVKWLLRELGTMSAEDERFEPRVTVMIELVRHHVEEEEDELFRYLRDVGTRQELRELGAELEAAKRSAPTVPGDLDGEGLLAPIGTALGHAHDVGRDVLERVGSLAGS